MRALESYIDASYSCWFFGNKLPTAHTALSAALFLLHTAVGNIIMNKFVNCLQWRNEHLKAQNVVIFSGQQRYECSALYWLRRCESSAMFGNCGMMPVAMLRPVQIYHIFPIHTCSLSSLCVVCIIVHYKYSHLYPAYAS